MIIFLRIYFYKRFKRFIFLILMDNISDDILKNSLRWRWEDACGFSTPQGSTRFEFSSFSSLFFSFPLFLIFSFFFSPFSFFSLMKGLLKGLKIVFSPRARRELGYRTFYTPGWNWTQTGCCRRDPLQRAGRPPEHPQLPATRVTG